ncbi:SpoIIE family protein phosphatase [Frigoribacterium faeni]|uniref:PP2C family protein-serine/threonine phosphatase n=1 Tax=Frigoribacterium TaxID=96492 RepID=UPI001FAB5A34|nr:MULTISPECIES: SpoIIE family protein phosphatase [Frigoribacterium]MCJ0702343.1 SpoIIE family protein phosphatase [Frigoribacterium faeni]MDY0892182.1 SpoIIE family protein phosphatase [Frigoribacterium sp. CFBP9030]
MSDQSTSGPRSRFLTRAAERISTRRLPFVKQAFIAALMLAAGVLSTSAPWLTVTDAVALWSGVALAGLALGFALAIDRGVVPLRWELLIPAADFVAVGLLRHGTGDSRSVYLNFVLLPIVWIAANPGRRHVVYPAIGSSVTLLMPFLFDPSGPPSSEVVRLVLSVVVYGTLAVAVNELARQAELRLTLSQARRRAVQGELDRAAVVQQSLLPPDASTLPNSFSVFGACVPARTVGGDFFDWYPTDDGIALTLGDVMGKGVGAGMIAAAVRAVMRSSADESDPATALKRASTGVETGGLGVDTQFTTCFHARIGMDGVIHWSDAGHGLAVLRRADGTVERLRSLNLPIGIGTEWTTFTTQARAGDTLICVSDGVLDLYDDELEAVNRFEDLVRQTPGAAAIVHSIAATAGLEERPDDVTVMAATFEPARTTPTRD